MSNYNSQNLDGESSNAGNFSDDDWLLETNPTMMDYVSNFPEMATQWLTVVEEENAQIPPTLPKKKRRYLRRDREKAMNRIMKQYFIPPTLYDDATFQTRFRMCRHVFLRIVHDVTNHDPFFQQRADACGKMGFTPIHKCTAAMRHLAYGAGYDQLDESLAMGKTTVQATVEHFAKAIIDVYQERYLRKADELDVRRLSLVASNRGFPGMLGSIDCMHWEWKNCPTGWKGQFQGRSGRASIILEAVAGYDTHIWHNFFGMAGSNNDINVLNKSDLFDDMCEGTTPPCEFVANGTTYNQGYYLTNDIYPKWAAFMPAYVSPNLDRLKVFSQKQESYRKDVERAFGILRARFAVNRNPAKYWSYEALGHIMKACIILHNMIVEDERDTYNTHVEPSDYEQRDPTHWHVHHEHPTDIATYRANWRQVRNRDLHDRLKHDLTEHVYQKFGPSSRRAP